MEHFSGGEAMNVSSEAMNVLLLLSLL